MTLVKTVVDEIGAYVLLPEYGNREGMISVSEYSKKAHSRSSLKLKEGHFEPATVTLVDAVKGHIDLSKRRVSAADAVKCKEYFAKSKRLYDIVRKYRESEGVTIPPSEIWAFYGKEEHPLDVLIGLPTPFGFFVKKIVAPEPTEKSVQFECSCLGAEGIEAIKESLRAGVTDHSKVVIGDHGYYRLSVRGIYEADIDAEISRLLDLISAKIRSYDGGIFKN